MTFSVDEPEQFRHFNVISGVHPDKEGLTFKDIQIGLTWYARTVWNRILLLVDARSHCTGNQTKETDTGTNVSRSR